MSRSGYFWLISSRNVGIVLVAVVGDRGEARGERGERLGRGLRPRELLVVERDRAVEVEHRDQALVEAALVDRASGARLRLGGERVERLAGDALERGDRVGAQTPWCDCGWISWRWALPAPIGSRPFFGSDIISVPPPTTRSSMPAMIAFAAMLLAVMPEPQNRSRVTPLARDVVAGVERRHPTEVAALLADLRAGAPHDVVDIGGVEAVALDQRLEHGAAEVLRVQVRERALALLADPAGRAAGVDDQCVGHQRSSSWGGRSSKRRRPA